jgi:tRNAThr (cytosine32-N3)-methyltransferase
MPGTEVRLTTDFYQTLPSLSPRPLHPSRPRLHPYPHPSTNPPNPSVDPSTDPLYQSYTTQQLAFQRAHAVTPFDQKRFSTNPEKWWDKFYSNNAGNFFKDRKWLRQEFPILDECTKALSSSPSSQKGPWNVVVEVGAGAGNTAFPILQGNENPNLKVHALDFSPRAISVIQSNPLYQSAHISASVWDIASPSLPPSIPEGSVDVILLIFIFSALSPSQWEQAVKNVWRLLRPGGEVCFRDYGRGDLAQVRFKKGRWLGENFYVRGDGTRVYFFGEDELREIWGGGLGKRKAEGAEGQEGQDGADGQVDKEEERTPEFEILNLGADRRLLVNRQKQLKMYRCWMQGRFRKSEVLGQASDPTKFEDTDGNSEISLNSSEISLSSR